VAETGCAKEIANRRPRRHPLPFAHSGLSRRRRRQAYRRTLAGRFQPDPPSEAMHGSEAWGQTSWWERSQFARCLLLQGGRTGDLHPIRSRSPVNRGLRHAGCFAAASTGTGNSVALSCEPVMRGVVCNSLIWKRYFTALLSKIN